MKLLFVCNNMHIGGIQKSLLNLLKEISKKYEVTLFLFFPVGDLLKDVPYDVRVKSGNFYTRIMGMSQAEAKKDGFKTAAWRTLWVIVTRILGIRASYGILSKMQNIDDEYDAVISFMQNSSYRMFYGGCNEFVNNFANSGMKIAFVHCDFKNYFGNNSYNRKYYKNFDRIACVSDSCKVVFEGVCPEYSDKTYSVHNCYDFVEMQVMSNAYKVERTEGAVNLFTAARISAEKGILRMLPIMARLKKRGIKFVWRIAGDGPLLESAIEERDKYGLSDNVIFLKMLDNPYPYFKSSDMMLVPSYDEAAPMVYGEAAYFNLPVFTTDVTSAHELIEAPDIGFVCKNDDKEIEKKLSELLSNPKLIFSKRKSSFMSNDTALSEFEALIK